MRADLRIPSMPTTPYRLVHAVYTVYGKDMDRHTAEPTLEDVEREWPRWHTWVGVSGLLYASRGLTSPPVLVRGEDAMDLRDQIRGWEGRRS